MSTFCLIKREEMESFLLGQGFTLMQLPNTGELVYGKLFKNGQHSISMRIYTSIAMNGVSRPKGEDAIRLVLLYKYENEINSLFSETIKRITTWKKNLQKHINNAPKHLKICPKCGFPMTIRIGKENKFWGCATWKYTKCNATMQLSPEDQKL